MRFYYQGINKTDKQCSWQCTQTAERKADKKMTQLHKIPSSIT